MDMEELVLDTEFKDTEGRGPEVELGVMISKHRRVK
jgi:hypothetical protein